jgi:hypothetical protein
MTWTWSVVGILLIILLIVVIVQLLGNKRGNLAVLAVFDSGSLVARKLASAK